MIEIDGSHGEGGGQILRTSLALSILTQKPFRISNIRTGRKSPGLKPQHLTGVQAAAEISSGRSEGALQGSTELIFHPGRVHPGAYHFDVATAGSTGLIFQTLLWPLGFSVSTSSVMLKGGTHVAWSPPADYLQQVFLPTVAPMGIRSHLRTDRHGFYPIGGGVLDIDVTPFRLPLKPLLIETRGSLQRLSVLSGVANLPSSIGNRQTDRAILKLHENDLDAEGESRSFSSPGKGTFCFILAEFDNVRAGFSSLGEIGKRAEQVADEAVDAFLRYWEKDGALDVHLADQVVLPMALAEGESVVALSEISDHLRTNVWVVEQFLPVRFHVKADRDEAGGLVRVSGCGLRYNEDHA